MSQFLIFRKIEYRKGDVRYTANSNGHSIESSALWDSPTGDIERLLKLCWNERKDFSQIHSLDIETVSWIPKAYEGFIYLLCLTSLMDDSIQVNQWINITRIKDGLVPILDDFFNLFDSDSTLVVFNKSFDLPVLKRMIERHKLPYKFPKVIIDPSTLIRKLNTFEEEKLRFKRKDTSKDDRKIYSKIFKTKQEIDPYGIYNIADTMTPLLGFLRFNKELEEKRKISRQTKATHRKRTPSSLTPIDIIQMRLARGEISVDEYKLLRSIFLEESKQAILKIISTPNDITAKKRVSTEVEKSEKMGPDSVKEISSRTSYGVKTLIIRNKKVKLQFFDSDEPKCLIALPKTKEDNRKVRNIFPGIKKRRCVIICDSILPHVNHWEITVHSYKVGTLLFRIEN